ncbi:MAG: response regulator transcription factor [Bacteroidales bacterium]|nr:response regulator transcription factor [Bacteroidales bacterium]
MKENNHKILLAEDDTNLGNLLKEYLDAKGFKTTLCVNGDEAFVKYKKEPFDLCLLDIMMPIKDGFTLAKEIRRTDKRIPIIFLTAKSMKQDAIEGFHIGADDYITKPFSMEELLLRIQAVLKRSFPFEEKVVSKNIYDIGKFNFNYNTQILKAGEIQMKLTSKESELLKLLCDNMNQVVERNYALNVVWGNDSYFNARSMDVYITKLRKYLREDDIVELMNIHGKGFKLIIKK